MLTEEERRLLEVALASLEPNLCAVIEKLLSEYDEKSAIAKFAAIDLPDEEWRWIHGYEGIYQVSNKGRVKSFQHGRVFILKQNFMNGYFHVMLYKNGIPKSVSVHRLVAQAFIPNPENKPQVDHIDTDKTNNCVENLRWATCAENTAYAFEAGVVKTGEDKFGAKLTEEAVRYIRENYKPNDPEFGQNALARKFGVVKNCIRQVLVGKTWRHVK